VPLGQNNQPPSQKSQPCNQSSQTLHPCRRLAQGFTPKRASTRRCKPNRQYWNANARKNFAANLVKAAFFQKMREGDVTVTASVGKKQLNPVKLQLIGQLTYLHFPPQTGAA
jgi:hypothetical protein